MAGPAGRCRFANLVDLEGSVLRAHPAPSFDGRGNDEWEWLRDVKRQEVSQPECLRHGIAELPVVELLGSTREIDALIVGRDVSTVSFGQPA